MKKKMAGLGALALILGVTTLSAGTALAYQGDPAVPGPNYSPERHTAMTNAFATGDYAAWKSLMPNRGRVAQVVTESNFAKFAEAHQLAQQGKTAEAQAIRQELGLGLRAQDGSGHEGGRGAWRGMNR